jgi:hypothetical protein
VKLNVSSGSIRLLYLLLATDLVFIVLHLIHVYTSFAVNPSFSIGQERGYADIFQFVKEYWIVLLLGFLALRKKSILYLGWFLLFLYILLDDSLEIHEKLGEIISNKLAFLPAFNLRAADFGELVVSAFFGLFFLIFIATAYRFSDRISRKLSRYLIMMLFALALFGIVVDMLHIAVKSPSLEPLLGLVEDGGEQIVMSVMAWFVFLLPERLQSGTIAKPISGRDNDVPYELNSTR